MVKVESKSSFNGEFYNFEVKRKLDPLGTTPANTKRRLDGDGGGIEEFN